MSNLICEGCEEEIEDDHIEFNGEDWHEVCFGLSGGPTYCCGQIYEDGETICRSCGDPV